LANDEIYVSTRTAATFSSHYYDHAVIVEEEIIYVSDSDEEGSYTEVIEEYIDEEEYNNNSMNELVSSNQGDQENQGQVEVVEVEDSKKEEEEMGNEEEEEEEEEEEKDDEEDEEEEESEEQEHAAPLALVQEEERVTVDNVAVEHDADCTEQRSNETAVTDDASVADGSWARLSTSVVDFTEVDDGEIVAEEEQQEGEDEDVVVAEEKEEKEEEEKEDEDDEEEEEFAKEEEGPLPEDFSVEKNAVHAGDVEVEEDRNPTPPEPQQCSDDDEDDERSQPHLEESLAPPALAEEMDQGTDSCCAVPAVAETEDLEEEINGENAAAVATPNDAKESDPGKADTTDCEEPSISPSTPTKSPRSRKVTRTSSFGKGLHSLRNKMVRRNSRRSKKELANDKEEATFDADTGEVVDLGAPAQAIAEAPEEAVDISDEAAAPNGQEHVLSSPSTPNTTTKKKGLRKLVRSMSFGLKSGARRGSDAAPTKSAAGTDGDDEAVEESRSDALSDGATPTDSAAFDEQAVSTPSNEEVEVPASPSTPSKKKRGLKKLVRRISFGKGKFPAVSGEDPSTKEQEEDPSEDSAAASSTSRTEAPTKPTAAENITAQTTGQTTTETKGLKKSLIRSIPFEMEQLSPEKMEKNHALVRGECAPPSSEQQQPAQKKNGKKLLRSLSFGKGKNKTNSTTKDTCDPEDKIVPENKCKSGIKRVVRDGGSGKDQGCASPKAEPRETMETVRSTTKTKTTTTTTKTVSSTSKTSKKPTIARKPKVVVTTTTRTENIVAPPSPQKKTEIVHGASARSPSTTVKSFHVEKDEAKPLGWEKPDWTKKPVLKKTLQGEAVKHGESLAKPVTFPVGKGDVVNRRAQPDEVLMYKGGPDAEEERDLSWKKPSWATNSPLKQTSLGVALKSGKDIHRPIGGIKQLEL